MNNNQKKAAQLGMPAGTANAKLRKNILFKLVQQLSLDFCFQCGARIETVDEFSIEHKVPWLDGDTELFWDLDNIAFSHLNCNIRAGRKPTKVTSPEGMSWCKYCKQHLPVEHFNACVSSNGRNGLQKECKSCASERYARRKTPV